MISTFKRLLGDRKGVTALEYGLIAGATIGAIALTLKNVIYGNLLTIYNAMANSL